MLIADMDSARDLVKIELQKQGLTQVELARRLGLAPASVSRTLRAPPIRQDSHWPAILDALGLEVIIRPKNRQL